MLNNNTSTRNYNPIKCLVLDKKSVKNLTLFSSHGHTVKWTIVVKFSFFIKKKKKQTTEGFYICLTRREIGHSEKKAVSNCFVLSN